MPLGVEFSGGTIVIVQFDQLPDSQQVRTALDQAMPGVGQNASSSGTAIRRRDQVMIRVPMVGAEAGGSLSQTADAVAAALEARRISGSSRSSAPRSSARVSASS